jgi:hypothetical protein
MLVTCPCNHCDQNIEFEASEFIRSGDGAKDTFGQTIPCPHCGHNTILTMPHSKLVAYMGPDNTLRGRTKLIVLCIAALVLAYIIFIIWKFPEMISDISVGIFHGGAAIVAIIVSVWLFVLAVFWLIFPWMVYCLLKQIEQNTRK